MLPRKTQNKIAVSLLHHKEHGYSMGYAVRRGLWKAWALLVILAAAFMVVKTYLRSINVDTLAVFVVGMITGAIVRDLGWLRAVRLTWPVTDRVTNWDEVRRLEEETRE